MTKVRLDKSLEKLSQEIKKKYSDDFEKIMKKMQKDNVLIGQIKDLLERHNLLNKMKKSAKRSSGSAKRRSGSAKRSSGSAKRRSGSANKQQGGSSNNAGGPGEGLGFMIEFFLTNPGMIFVFFAATVIIGGAVMENDKSYRERRSKEVRGHYGKY